MREAYVSGVVRARSRPQTANAYRPSKVVADENYYQAAKQFEQINSKKAHIKEEGHVSHQTNYLIDKVIRNRIKNNTLCWDDKEDILKELKLKKKIGRFYTYTFH